MPLKQINRRTGGFNTPPKFRLRRGIIRNYQPKITKAIKFTKLIMKLVGHMIKSCEDPRISLLVWSIKPMNWQFFLHVCSKNIITYLIMQTPKRRTWNWSEFYRIEEQSWIWTYIMAIIQMSTTKKRVYPRRPLVSDLQYR